MCCKGAERCYTNQYACLTNIVELQEVVVSIDNASWPLHSYSLPPCIHRLYITPRVHKNGRLEYERVTP